MTEEGQSHNTLSTKKEEVVSEPTLDVEHLKSQVDEWKGKSAQCHEVLLRTRAELENHIKRTERELEKAHKYGVSKLLEALLPVKDSLDFGILASEGESNIEPVVEGMKLTNDKFEVVLNEFGLTVINPEGERFNPEKHEAVSTAVAATLEENTVLQVLQKGYMLHDRVLRAARVIVSKPN